jgi:hypothetical protein
MQRVITLCIIMGIAGCKTIRPPELPQGKVTYYDRNHDGRVDFEFHEVGFDVDWALADRDYDGYYDLYIFYGVVGAEIYKIHKPVAAGVKITKGRVPVLITDYGQSVLIPH